MMKSDLIPNRKGWLAEKRVETPRRNRKIAIRTFSKVGCRLELRVGNPGVTESDGKC
jgi:hypothetical protein